MCRPLRYVLRFLVLVVAVTSLSILLAPTPTTNSPYLSALSDLTWGQALAKPSCTRSTCTNGTCVPGQHHTNCIGVISCTGVVMC